MATESNVYPDTVEYHDAIRAYNEKPTKENLERVHLAEAEHEKKSFERMQAAQEAMRERVKELVVEQKAVQQVKKPETKLDRTKALMKRTRAALVDCRAHNKKLHDMLKENVKHKRTLSSMLEQLRERKQDLLKETPAE